jgi:hypothetical protein
VRLGGPEVVIMGMLPIAVWGGVAARQTQIRYHSLVIVRWSQNVSNASIFWILNCSVASTSSLGLM